MSAPVVQQAVRTLESSPLRAMDALHVGAAIVCKADMFVSADARQCAAARTAGLRTARV